MQRFLTIILVTLTFGLCAQVNPTQEAQPIVEEGKMLYRSEMTSWLGTDIFLENYEETGNVGGYFSYEDGDSTRCVFYSNASPPEVIGTISFDSTIDGFNAVMDLTPRDFRGVEEDYYNIRQHAVEMVRNDKMFKVYNLTSLNVIPIIKDGVKKAYILTGPQETGVVVFGNDYLILFDDNYEVLLKKQLHQNLIPVDFNVEGNDSLEVVGTMHNHSPETGDFITATDICTLMLYGKMAKWKTHNVISQKYLNIWSCETETLVVVPLNMNKVKMQPAETEEEETPEKTD